MPYELDGSEIKGYPAVRITYNGFTTRENAKRLCDKLGGEGYLTHIYKNETGRGKIRYLVFRTKEKVK